MLLHARRARGTGGCTTSGHYAGWVPTHNSQHMHVYHHPVYTHAERVQTVQLGPIPCFRMAPSAASAQSPSGRRRSGDLENAAPSAWSGISRFGFKKRAASTRSRTEQATTEAPSGNVKQTKAACPPLDLKPDSGAARAITRATPRLVENIKVTADKYGRRALKGANLAAPWRRQTWQQSAVELHYSSTM